VQNRLGSSALFVALFTNFYIDKILVKAKHNGRGYTGIAADRCTVIYINSVTNILGQEVY